MSDEEILGSKEENWVDDGTHGAQLGSKYATTPQATSPLHGVQISLAIPTPLWQWGNLAITTPLSSPSTSWAGCYCGEQLGQSRDASGQYFQSFARSVYLFAVLNTLSHQLLCSQYRLCSTNLTNLLSITVGGLAVGLEGLLLHRQLRPDPLPRHPLPPLCWGCPPLCGENNNFCIKKNPPFGC